MKANKMEETENIENAEEIITEVETILEDTQEILSRIRRNNLMPAVCEEVKTIA